MIKLRKKKKSNIKIAAEFSANGISVEKLCNYLAWLAVSNRAQFVGYRFIDKGEVKRIILLVEDFNIPTLQYFKDRCPAMIEQEVLEYGSSYTGGYNVMPVNQSGFFYVSPIRF